MESKYILSGDGLHRETRIDDQSVNVDRRQTIPFLEALGERAPMESGLLPPGLRYLRQAGEHMQMVIECPPAINLIIWGEYERDANAKKYLLAQPWRVIVADFLNSQLLGGRMYYTYGPLYTLDQELYHTNLPNTNCRGYRGNGVGWVCLYHKEDWSKLSIAEKAFKITQHISGGEAYNNANMSETDGTRFYQAAGKPKYTWDPVTWEKKSAKEGTDWTLQDDLWIPILVKDKDDQGNHYPGGVPLTLDMAMSGHAAAYYGDKLKKPVNLLRRGEADGEALLQSVFTGAFNKAPMDGKTEVVQQKADEINALTKAIKAAKKKLPAAKAVPIPVPEEYFTCSSCDDEFNMNDAFITEQEDYICEGCRNEWYSYTACCDKLKNNDHIFFVENDGTGWCGDGGCYSINECQGCFEQFPNVPQYWTDEDHCTNCGVKSCVHCENLVKTNETFTLNAPAPMLSMTVCKNCVKHYAICAKCLCPQTLAMLQPTEEGFIHVEQKICTNNKKIIDKLTGKVKVAKA